MSYRTWNHKDYNITLNGLALTDFNGDVTVEMDEDLWSFTEGQNGAVERSLMDGSLATVTMPMMATSTQLDAIAAFDIADRKTNAGPYVFTATRVGANFKLVGRATIAKISAPTRAKQAAARNVTLKVVVDASWMGA